MLDVTRHDGLQNAANQYPKGSESSHRMADGNRAFCLNVPLITQASIPMTEMSPIGTVHRDQIKQGHET